jgi:hypothetical protein
VWRRQNEIENDAIANNVLDASHSNEVIQRQSLARFFSLDFQSVAAILPD